MTVKNMFDLKGKTSIVTGGSIGLGSYMAIGLAEAGANVVVAARKVERCEVLCRELSKFGVGALPVACDVGKSDDCKALVDSTVKEFGAVDILVNNAGLTWAADAMNYPMDKWQKVMDINLTGLFQLSTFAAQVMKEKGYGKIINITSVAGFGGTTAKTQNTVAYNASKGAIITLTKDLAVKWSKYGIYVNAIAPGFFPTHMSAGLLEKNQHLVLPRVPLNRFGNENDLKGPVIFLASSASDYITGQILPVDGGILAMV